MDLTLPAAGPCPPWCDEGPHTPDPSGPPLHRAVIGTPVIDQQDTTGATRAWVECAQAGTDPATVDLMTGAAGTPGRLAVSLSPGDARHVAAALTGAATLAAWPACPPWCEEGRARVHATADGGQLHAVTLGSGLGWSVRMLAIDHPDDNRGVPTVAVATSPGWDDRLSDVLALAAAVIDAAVLLAATTGRETG